MTSIKKFLFLLSITLLSINSAHAQLDLNDYKYVVVEDQFHFQNEKDEYNLNQLVRFLFRKHGFRVIMEGDALPEELKSNYCLALTSEVTAKGTLRTKALITLRNCDNIIVFKSEEGVTKVKEFDRAYDLAIRDAFESFADFKYEYNGSNESRSTEKELSVAEPEKVKEDSKTEVKVEAKEEVKPEVKEGTPMKTESIEKVEETKSVETNEIIEEKIEDSPAEKFDYTAVAIENGFEIRDSKGQIKYTIYKSSMDNLFTIKDQKGIIYKKGGVWTREYVEDGETVYESLSIKF